MLSTNREHIHSHEDHESLVVEDDIGNLEGQIIIDALQEVLVARGLLTAPEVLKEIEKLEYRCSFRRKNCGARMDRSRL